MNVAFHGLISKSKLFIRLHLPSPCYFPPALFLVKNGKNGKPHVLTLQDMEQDSVQFDLAADTLEELFEWYQVSWDITQREMSKQYNREQEVSISRLMAYYIINICNGGGAHLS